MEGGLMKRLVVIMVAIIAVACAKVSVETKEPIKVDVNMRVDIYQHVVEDVQSINDQIYGGSQQEFNSLFFIHTAYAQDASSAMQAAISRMILRGESSLPVILAGHTAVHLPHSVQARESR